MVERSGALIVSLLIFSQICVIQKFYIYIYINTLVLKPFGIACWKLSALSSWIHVCCSRLGNEPLLVATSDVPRFDMSQTMQERLKREEKEAAVISWTVPELWVHAVAGRRPARHGVDAGNARR